MLLLTAANTGGQQRERDGNDPMVERIEILEAETLYLRNEVNALRERLDALLGKSPENRIFDLSVGDSLVRGAPEGKITLMEFGDYQSEYATRAAHVVGRLLEDYPSALRFIFKHYPLTTIHPQATEAVLVALAAEKQGRGWEMHDLLFKNSRRLDENLFLMLAQDLGLNLT